MQRHQQSVSSLGQCQGCCLGDLPTESPSQSIWLPRPPRKAALPPQPGSVLPQEPYVKEVGWGKGGTWGPLSFISPELKKDTIKQFF